MNIKNRTLYIADNLDVMQNIDSECIDLIYLDPPFNSNEDYQAPIGGPAEGANFKDIWREEDIRTHWIDNIGNRTPEIRKLIECSEITYDKTMPIYLTAMTIRLYEMHRILKSTGSIYYHCDDHASHYIKIAMDAIFGKDNFLNEVVWQRTSAHNNAKRYGRIHDYILYYAKNEKKRTWNTIYTPHNSKNIKSKYRYSDKIGVYRHSDLTAPNRSGKINEWKGSKPPPGRIWSAPKRSSLPKEISLPENYEKLSTAEKLDLLDKLDIICWPKNGERPYYKKYLSTTKGRKLQDVIHYDDIPPVNARAKERTGWPTQKPVPLIERFIEASSHKGDMILDPFCGCATACVAAEKLGRQWVGIDMCPDAELFTKIRLDEETMQGELGEPSKEVIVTTKPPKISDARSKNSYKNELYGEQKGLCAGCRDPHIIDNFDVDHIVPKSQQGPNTKDNYQLLCPRCHRIKGTKPQAQFLQNLKEEGYR